jgi:hypothetical protein
MAHATPLDNHPLSAVSWQERLQATASAAEIVGVARDFVAQLTPYDVHSLPEACRPPSKIVDAEDITSYAFALVRHQCEESAAHAELVHKLAHFFSEASIRLSQLAVPHSLPEDSERWSA